MATVITFKIHPSNTIDISVLNPCTASDPYLTIEAPDGTKIKFTTATQRLKDFTQATIPWVDKNVIFTIDELNTSSSGVLIDSSDNVLSELPWDSFPPGIYSVYFAESGDPSTPDLSYFLEFTTILDCMYTTINDDSDCCYESEPADHSKKLIKMMNLKFGAELDFKYGNISEAKSKTSVLESICNNTDCGCKNCG